MGAVFRSQSGRTSAVAATVAWSLLALPASGLQTPDTAPVEPPSDELLDRVRADVDETPLRWLGVFRVRYSVPLEFSVGGGALVAPVPVDHDCTAFCEYRGLIAQIEPGSSGAQLGVGYARLVGAQHPASAFLNNVYVGWSARAVVVRTWGNSGLDPKRQTLTGFEGQFALPRVSFYLGVLRRISSAHEGADRWVATAGFGWGF